MSAFNRKEWANKEAKHVAKHVTMKYGNNIPMTECYEMVVNEAVKLFNELEDLPHTEESKVMIKRFLSRLIEDKPLSPIEDGDDMWDEVGSPFEEDTGVEIYINKRLRTLFKRVDGNNVSYYDGNRVTCVNMLTDNNLTLSFVEDFIDKHYPIEFPYFPTEKYVVNVKLFLHDGSYIMNINHVIDPNGKLTFFNECYATNEEREWKKISFHDFNNRFLKHRKATTDGNERSSQDSI